MILEALYYELIMLIFYKHYSCHVPTLVGAVTQIFVNGHLVETLKRKKSYATLPVENTYYIAKLKLLLSLFRKTVCLRPPIVGPK